MSKNIVSELKLTEDEGIARYVKILGNRFGCRLTVGELYEIKRAFGSPQIYGDDGEIQIVDDEGKDLAGIQMLCEVDYYV